MILNTSLSRPTDMFLPESSSSMENGQNLLGLADAIYIITYAGSSHIS